MFTNGIAPLDKGMSSFELEGSTQFINMDIMTKREKLKEELAWLSLLSQAHIIKFKLIYSNEYLNYSIDYIIDNMATSKLDVALRSVQHAIANLQKINKVTT